MLTKALTSSAIDCLWKVKGASTARKRGGGAPHLAQAMAHPGVVQPSRRRNKRAVGVCGGNLTGGGTQSPLWLRQILRLC
jgi:hypothetical protein